MDRYKKLVNNSIIFTIGTFGSRLISFLMVPLYTHYLTTNEYGTVDLMNTTVSLLIPILTLELGQASLRYSIDKKNKIEQNKIFSNIIGHLFVVTILVLLALPIIIYFNIFKNYAVMFIVLLILRITNNLYSYYIRGIGFIKQFAFNGILMTLVTVISNIILLVYFNLKVDGYILSFILAALISNIYLFHISNGYKRMKNFMFDRILFKEMLKFSVPIVPNSAMWWIINSSTRYFILYFVGAAGNGIFAVANKIPAIISMATGIFSQAWQLSSFEEYESESKDEFYSKIFNIYWVLLFLSGSALIVVLRPLVSVLVDDAFFESWKVAPLLILAVIYQSFSSFLGMNYTAAKETKGTFSTSVFAGLSSLTTSLILIPYLGLIGAGLSSAVSFFIMFVLRLIDTQKYVKTKIKKWPFILTNITFAIQILSLYLFSDGILIIVELIIFMILMLINRSTILSLLKLLRKGIKRIIKK